MLEVAEPLCGLAEANPLEPDPFTELFPDWAEPVDPVLPDWVEPLVLALPDLVAEPEFDVVLTAPDCPPLPELPEMASGLEVALPISVEPVEPVFPEVADELPQLPVTVTHGETVIAGPELPEFPEFPDLAEPVEVADPVLPESAFPELAWVSLELVEVAFPVLPPVVVPVALESPLLPEVALAVEPSLACPVLAEVAVPSALPAGCPLPHPLEPAWAGPLCGSDVAEPLFPEPFCEELPALAGPVAPVSPDWVLPMVSAFPD